MADISKITLPNGQNYNIKDSTARNAANSAVPNTRTVNGKALSSDISLGAGDVGAYTKSETDTKIDAAVASAYKYKGSVTADKLPTSGQVVGDVYNITNDSSYGKAGMNVAWNGTTWDALGSNVDLSNYVTTSDSRLSNARPANGGNASTVNGHTVNSDVPAGAKFTDTTYSAATQSANGLMSAADKSKLDAIGAGSNVKSVNGKTGAVNLSKADVGLGNVDNTSDVDKPISTAVQEALDGKANNAVSEIINDHINNKNNPHVVTKAQVGLGSVANLDQSKAIKSITRSGTTFTATALDGTTTTFTQQDSNTTYGIATSSADGLMSAADKTKLDDIDAGLDALEGWVSSLDMSLAKLYPVGSIYLSVNDTNPGTFIGGRWERLKDVFLLAAGDTYTAGATGGEAQHTLTVDEMPSHTHFSNDGWSGYASKNYRTGMNNVLTYSKNAGDYTTPYRDTNLSNIDSTLSSTGKNQPHNNMPPYLTVYMWKRVS